MRVGSEKPAAAAAPRREHLTRVIAVVNGKGGVLKTSLTANVGGQLARRGFAVLLVDLDVSGNLKLDLGMRDPDMGVWAYQYDGNGNLTLQTDAP